MSKKMSVVLLSLILVSPLAACSESTSDYANMSSGELAETYCEEALICDGLPSTSTDAEVDACSLKFENSLNSLSSCKKEIVETMDCILDIHDACFPELGANFDNGWCSDEISSMNKCVKSKYPELDYNKVLYSLFGDSLSASSLSIDSIADKYCSNKSSCDQSVDKSACITKATSIHSTYKQCRTETSEYLYCLNNKFITCTTSKSESCSLEKYSLEACLDLNYDGFDQFPFDEDDDF